MKKVLLTMIFVVFAAVLVACGSGDQGSKNESQGNETNNEGASETKTLKVGASPVPHYEILEQAKPLLKEKGIDLEITEFTDYVLPNKSLEEKAIDANFFQHEPYLKQQIADNGYKFVSIGGVHIEPIGVYSKKYKSLDELPDGATIIMSNSVADHGRMLSMLEEKGLIVLKEGIEKTAATVEDIAKNPKKLVFKADIDPAMLTKAYENDEGDAVLINGNFAMDAGLDPSKDSIALESPDNNPYVNLVVVREGDENREEIKALIEVLQSAEIQNWIKENYKGAVLPVKGE
ncbi:MetQ/NlpA family ABC transporter substrate-binding protein [Metabacillus fastidiosus]|uniref:MetQ/NlpA family ABC transporter substrate-binding protein n=1 Tax=Metabacillus fastidiosus TaxID=1458 RepID=UPI003D2A971E